jgi:hypothetical protein
VLEVEVCSDAKRDRLLALIRSLDHFGLAVVVICWERPARAAGIG